MTTTTDQQMAIDLMGGRLKNPSFVPDYDLLVDVTGMKERLE